MAADERGERTRAVNKLRAGGRDRLTSLKRESMGADAPLFNPKADISKGIARKADPADPWESPNSYKPLPGAPVDANAGATSRVRPSKAARDKVAARRYPTR